MYFTGNKTIAVLFLSIILTLFVTGLRDAQTRQRFWNKNIKLCGSGQHQHPNQLQWKLRSESESSLPSFHFSEVKSDLSVGYSLLIQVAAIPPYERRHIIAYITKKRSEGVKTNVMTQMNIGWVFNLLLAYCCTICTVLVIYLVGHFYPKNCWGWIVCSLKPDTV